MKKIIVLFLIGCQLSVISGQQVVKNEVGNLLSGSLNLDSKIAYDKSEKIITPSLSNIDDQKKSVWLAVGLSAVLPGAGEFYSESYIKSAAFIAVEAAAITLGLIYDKKGNDQTDFFQNYADQHWSVDRYAAWTIKHATSINGSVDPTKYNVFVNGKVDWAELNRLEGDLGTYYSHRLPKYGEQQYFELIGKYPQFNVGWDDFGDVNTPYFYGDPLTQKFLYYAEERGKANNFYNVAAKAVLVVVVNHIVSAVDAAWTAHSYNKNLDMHASIERRDYGFITVYYPQLNLQYRF
ncbi:MAG: hypothetical protein NTX65_02455 [Ignavibacteriales bacterium]|nr:hypothetical protein [Ignavibacteriales bacterium]